MALENLREELKEKNRRERRKNRVDEDGNPIVRKKKDRPETPEEIKVREYSEDLASKAIAKLYARKVAIDNEYAHVRPEVAEGNDIPAQEEEKRRRGRGRPESSRAGSRERPRPVAEPVSEPTNSLTGLSSESAE